MPRLHVWPCTEALEKQIKLLPNVLTLKREVKVLFIVAVFCLSLIFEETRGKRGQRESSVWNRSNGFN